MQSAHDPFVASRDVGMFGPATPPQWPRTVARILGIIGFLLLAPFVTLMTIGVIIDAESANESGTPLPLYFLIMSVTVGSGLALVLGLVIAWWREGIGALLILAGATLVVGMTLGLALLVLFPAYAVGAFYLLSWALHRQDDAGPGTINEISRWIRQRYYGRRPETF